MKKFTFKKVKREGIWERQQTTIKLTGKKVGYISETISPNWAIRLMVKKEPTIENPAPFRWVTLKYRAQSEQEAREFLKLYYKKIQKKYALHFIED